jgi:hypothetical protein
MFGIDDTLPGYRLIDRLCWGAAVSLSIRPQFDCPDLLNLENEFISILK